MLGARSSKTNVGTPHHLPERSSHKAFMQRPRNPSRQGSHEREAPRCDIASPSPGPRLTEAMLAPLAGIAYTWCMQYTIRSIPARIDRALRERSKREGKSLNETALEALTRGLDLNHQPVRYRDLGSIAGSWVRDRAVDRALDEQRAIDPDLWR